jgi:hypothetical protein
MSSIFFSKAQTTFEKSFGGTNNDSASCIKQTSDGGYIICGSTNSFGAGDYDVYVIKMSATGSKLWTKTYGGSTADYGNSIIQTNDSGYLITGSTIVSNGDEQYYLIKIDSSGKIGWSETIYSDGPAKANAAIQTSDGGFALTGFSTFHGVKRINLLKTNFDGTGVFESHFDYAGEGNSILQLADGGFIINATRSGFSDSLTRDVLIKTDQYGNYLMGTTYDNNYSLKGSSVYATSDGGFVIGGSSVDSTIAASFSYLIKIDIYGNQTWAKIYNSCEVSHFQQTSDEGYIMTGLYYSGGNTSIFLSKTDDNGSIVWSKKYAMTNSNNFGFVQETIDGGYILAASTKNYGAGNLDLYIIKCDSLGNTSCSNNAVSIADSVTTLYEVTNYFTGLVYFYTDAYSVMVQTVADSSIEAVAGFMGTNLCAAAVIAPPPIIQSFNNTQSSDDNIVIQSVAIDGADRNENEIDQREENTDNKSVSMITEEATNETFNVFPNPNNGSNLNITVNTAKEQEVLVVVYDELGRESYSKVIYTGENIENTFAIDPSGKLKPGMYMVKATSEKNTFIRRLIVK